MARTVVETKVISAAAGSGAGAAFGSFALWLLGVVVWHAPNSAAAASQAVGAVPGPVSDLVLVTLAAAGAAVAGYAAPHTFRPAAPVVPVSAPAQDVLAKPVQVFDPTAVPVPNPDAGISVPEQSGDDPPAFPI